MIIVSISVAVLLAGSMLILNHKKNITINELKTKVKILQGFSDSVSVELNIQKTLASKFSAGYIGARNELTTAQSNIKALEASIANTVKTVVISEKVDKVKDFKPAAIKAGQPRVNTKKK